MYLYLLEKLFKDNGRHSHYPFFIVEEQMENCLVTAFNK